MQLTTDKKKPFPAFCCYIPVKARYTVFWDLSLAERMVLGRLLAVASCGANKTFEYDRNELAYDLGLTTHTIKSSLANLERLGMIRIDSDLITVL